MVKTAWTISRSGSSKRPWRVTRQDEVAENANGKPRGLACDVAAKRAAEKLNDEEGIFVSGFIGVGEGDAKLARERFLAGDTAFEVRAHFRGMDGKLKFSVSQIRRMRNEVFAPLVNDPQAIKALADGPMLNPSQIVRYRHPREEVAEGAKQVEMFSS